MEPTYLIYGLIDPRTLLIRYIGMSSRGMRRPREHRSRTAPDTYCRRWVKTLQKHGLDYEITVLEVLTESDGLAQAERWWIAFGKTCGWPLTNIMKGGGPSECVLAKRRDVKKERARAKIEEKASKKEERLRREEERLRREDERLSLSAIGRELLAKRKRHIAQDLRSPEEIEQVCFQLFEKRHGSPRLFVDVVIGARVTSNTARELYDEWLDGRPSEEITNSRLEICCVVFFEKGRQPAEIARELKISSVGPTEIYKRWLQASCARAKRALEEDRKALYARLKSSQSPDRVPAV